MQCEMCGREINHPVVARIEGAILRVCPDCARYGEIVSDRKGHGHAVPSRGLDSGAEKLKRALEKRERRMREKDIFNIDNREIVPDYPDRVRNARNRKGLTREELARKINEKESVIAKVESGELIPDNKLVHKLEKFLGIKLLEEVKPQHYDTYDEDSGGGGITLGDLIKMQEK